MSRITHKAKSNLLKVAKQGSSKRIVMGLSINLDALSPKLRKELIEDFLKDLEKGIKV